MISMRFLTRERKNTRTHGFTLIEVSIVLVIVALIAAGIVGGMELVKSAGVRKQISQVESIDTAVNTFRNKYGCLPGDCAQGFDFPLRRYNGCASANINTGNGDGMIGESNYNINTTASAPAWETRIFWNVLIDARLVDAYYTQHCGYAPAGSHNYAIAGKFGANRPIIAMGHQGGFHQYYIGSWTGPGFNAPSATTGETLTPNEAYQMDFKMDDGLPATGQVRARQGSNVFILGVSPLGASDGITAPNRCVEPGNTRYANSSLNDSPRCVIAIRGAF